ncbi:Calcium uptake protein 3, mitochondrial [Trichinella sp. T8]|nr:Calcium uptake protein 3, mitochondrial [Trichinella sp. T8]
MLSYSECVTTLARRWRSSLQVRPRQTWSRGHKTFPPLTTAPSSKMPPARRTIKVAARQWTERLRALTSNYTSISIIMHTCENDQTLSEICCDCKPFGVVRSHFINCSTIEEANLPSWKRFFEFSSFNCEGKAYMSPFDFMQSLTSKASPEIITRKTLNCLEALQLTKETPSVTSSSCTFFRDANHQGLISYFDYLFLLSLLSEPESRFRIAFDLFDQNKDGKLEMDEFYSMASGILPKKLRESNG